MIDVHRMDHELNRRGGFPGFRAGPTPLRACCIEAAMATEAYLV